MYRSTPSTTCRRAPCPARLLRRACHRDVRDAGRAHGWVDSVILASRAGGSPVPWRSPLLPRPRERHAAFSTRGVGPTRPAHRAAFNRPGADEAASADSFARLGRSPVSVDARGVDIGSSRCAALTEPATNPDGRDGGCSLPARGRRRVGRRGELLDEQQSWLWSRPLRGPAPRSAPSAGRPSRRGGWPTPASLPRAAGR